MITLYNVRNTDRTTIVFIRKQKTYLLENVGSLTYDRNRTDIVRNDRLLFVIEYF